MVTKPSGSSREALSGFLSGLVTAIGPEEERYADFRLGAGEASGNSIATLGKGARVGVAYSGAPSPSVGVEAPGVGDIWVEPGVAVRRGECVGLGALPEGAVVAGAG
jgi:hypothetical protein